MQTHIQTHDFYSAPLREIGKNMTNDALRIEAFNRVFNAIKDYDFGGKDLQGVGLDAVARMVGAMSAAGLDEDVALRHIITGDVAVHGNDIVVFKTGDDKVIAGCRLLD
ncbi:MAG: hypothetical protein LBC70_03325 [Chitinispirillales bacterium]|nr:hypothetical protein [Chitinispirillales bacterium]